MKKGKISNVAGYLLKAFQYDYRTPETELTKIQQEELARKEAEEQVRIEKQEKFEQQKRDFENRKTGLVISRMEGLKEEELTEHKQDFTHQMESNPLFSKMLQSK